MHKHQISEVLTKLGVAHIFSTTTRQTIKLQPVDMTETHSEDDEDNDDDDDHGGGDSDSDTEEVHDLADGACEEEEQREVWRTMVPWVYE